jgi:hypothetical protein
MNDALIKLFAAGDMGFPIFSYTSFIVRLDIRQTLITPVGRVGLYVSSSGRRKGQHHHEKD